MSNVKTMKGSALQIADVVLDTDAHNLGLITVQNIKEGVISFFRPYTHTADFSYTGGVICYTGVETFKREVSDDRIDYELVSRKVLK